MFNDFFLFNVNVTCSLDFVYFSAKYFTKVNLCAYGCLSVGAILSFRGGGCCVPDCIFVPDCT